jgi:hypothetical protein
LPSLSIWISAVELSVFTEVNARPLDEEIA